MTTKVFFTALTAAALLAGPTVAPASAAQGTDAAIRVAQTQVPEKCKEIKDPAERAKCIRAEGNR